MPCGQGTWTVITPGVPSMPHQPCIPTAGPTPAPPYRLGCRAADRQGHLCPHEGRDRPGPEGRAEELHHAHAAQDGAGGWAHAPHAAGGSRAWHMAGYKAVEVGVGKSSIRGQCAMRCLVVRVKSPAGIPSKGACALATACRVPKEGTLCGGWAAAHGLNPGSGVAARQHHGRCESADNQACRERCIPYPGFTQPLGASSPLYTRHLQTGASSLAATPTRLGPALTPPTCRPSSRAARWSSAAPSWCGRTTTPPRPPMPTWLRWSGWPQRGCKGPLKVPKALADIALVEGLRGSGRPLWGCAGSAAGPGGCAGRGR
jgi:hypothetical protein